MPSWETLFRLSSDRTPAGVLTCASSALPILKILPRAAREPHGSARGSIYRGIAPTLLRRRTQKYFLRTGYIARCACPHQPRLWLQQRWPECRRTVLARHARKSQLVCVLQSRPLAFQPFAQLHLEAGMRRGQKIKSQVADWSAFRPWLPVWTRLSNATSAPEEAHRSFAPMLVRFWLYCRRDEILPRH